MQAAGFQRDNDRQRDERQKTKDNHEGRKTRDVTTLVTPPNPLLLKGRDRIKVSCEAQLVDPITKDVYCEGHGLFLFTPLFRQLLTLTPNP